MRSFLLLIFTIFLVGCAPKTITLSSETLEIEVLDWSNFSNLPSINEEFWEALKHTCKRVESIGEYCSLRSTDELKDSFVPVRIIPKGVMTGYYEPTLRGSETQNEKYKYPLYGAPKDMLQIDLSTLYPELSNYRLRGKLKNGRIVPYKSHQDIDKNGINAPVLCYVDSKIDAFFLHIQGSGKVVLENGNILNLGYADQNGHPYRAIGRIMKKDGYLEDVSMQSIRDFLIANPEKQDEILHANPSYVFFESKSQGATGAAGVELIANTSVAVDRRYIPLGMPLILKTDISFVSPWG
ncbi:MAG: hypothetical protein GX780_06135, partial [Campylobacteraceae bacterium]|nr:hypothetical protein [Campylobacteraceae bacterium]